MSDHRFETLETSTRYATSYVARCTCGWRHIAEYRLQADRAGRAHITRIAVEALQTELEQNSDAIAKIVGTDREG